MVCHVEVLHVVVAQVAGDDLLGPRFIVMDGAPPLHGRGSDRGTHPLLADDGGPVVQLVTHVARFVFARAPNLELLRPFHLIILIVMWGTLRGIGLFLPRISDSRSIIIPFFNYLGRVMINPPPSLMTAFSILSRHTSLWLVLGPNWF